MITEFPFFNGGKVEEGEHQVFGKAEKQTNYVK